MFILYGGTRKMSEKKLFKITIENIVDEQKYVIEYLANKNMR